MSTKTFFTSDTHFGHANIIGYCDRPFDSVANMNYELARRWNEVVGPSDTVYHLGDFAMGKPTEWEGFAQRLNGTKYLVRGNHDKKAAKYLAAAFTLLDANVIVEVEGKRLWMNHYPLVSEDRRDLRRPPAPGPYDIALCGHIHQRWTVKSGVVNVGVDVWGFRPISLAQIEDALEKGDH